MRHRVSHGLDLVEMAAPMTDLALYTALQAGWRSIETSYPPDREPVDLWCNGERVVDARWNTKRSRWELLRDGWELTADQTPIKEWFETQDKPTHWRFIGAPAT